MPLLILLADEVPEPAIGSAIRVDGAVGGPANTTVCVLFDTEMDVVEENPSFRTYRLPFDVEIYVYGATSDDLGPMISAAYGQLTHAVRCAPTLGGLVERIVERDLLVQIDRTQNTGPTASCSLGLYAIWDEPKNGVGATRAQVRAALFSVLENHAPLDDLIPREWVIDGVRSRLQVVLGKVERNAIRPVDLTDSTAARAVLIEGSQDANEERNVGETEYTLELAVELFSAEADLQARDADLDAREQLVRRVLLDTQAIGGVPVDVEDVESAAVISGQMDHGPSAVRRLEFLVRYEVEHPLTRHNVEALVFDDGFSVDAFEPTDFVGAP